MREKVRMVERMKKRRDARVVSVNNDQVREGEKNAIRNLRPDREKEGDPTRNLLK